VDIAAAMPWRLFARKPTWVGVCSKPGVHTSGIVFVVLLNCSSSSSSSCTSSMNVFLTFIAGALGADGSVEGSVSISLLVVTVAASATCPENSPVPLLVVKLDALKEDVAPEATPSSLMLSTAAASDEESEPTTLLPGEASGAFRSLDMPGVGNPGDCRLDVVEAGDGTSAVGYKGIVSGAT
jgi:hypothetical protein